MHVHRIAIVRSLRLPEEALSEETLLRVLALGWLLRLVVSLPLEVIVELQPSKQVKVVVAAALREHRARFIARWEHRTVIFVSFALKFVLLRIVAKDALDHLEGVEEVLLLLRRRVV